MLADVLQTEGGVMVLTRTKMAVVASTTHHHQDQKIKDNKAQDQSHRTEEKMLS